MGIRASGIAWVLVLLLLATAGGCGVFDDAPTQSKAILGKAGTDPEQLQAELMAFSETFISAVSQQWNTPDATPPPTTVATVAPAAPPPTPGASPVKAAGDRGRRASLEIKLANVTGALAIATGPNPTVGLADMITMITLQRMILEDDWAPQSLGMEKTLRIVATYQEQEAAVWRIAARVFTPEQQAELRDLISQWRRDHPEQRYVAGVRLEDFARERGSMVLADTQRRGSLLALVGLDPLSNLDPTVREVQRSRLLAERIFFYTQHAPAILKMQTESLYTGMFQTPEVKQTLTALADVSAAADNVADAADKLRTDLAKERHDALTDLFTQLQKERKGALDDIFQGLTEQRRQTIADLEKGSEKLGGTLKQVQDAAAATEKLTESLRTTIQAADALAARFTPAPGTSAPPDSGPKKDPIEQFQLAAASASQTVDKLTALADRVDRLLNSPQLDQNSGKLRGVVESLQGGVKETVDHAFWWIIAVAIIGAFCLGAAIALGLSGHKAMERRSAAKRRHKRKTETT